MSENPYSRDRAMEYYSDLVNKTLSQQVAKKQAYAALIAKGLDVPKDLKKEIEGHEG